MAKATVPGILVGGCGARNRSLREQPEYLRGYSLPPTAWRFIRPGIEFVDRIETALSGDATGGHHLHLRHDRSALVASRVGRPHQDVVQPGRYLHTVRKSDAGVSGGIRTWQPDRAKARKPSPGG